MSERDRELERFCQQLTTAMPEVCQIERLLVDVGSRQWHMVLSGSVDAESRSRCVRDLQKIIDQRWSLTVSWQDALPEVSEPRAGTSLPTVSIEFEDPLADSPYKESEEWEPELLNEPEETWQPVQINKTEEQLDEEFRRKRDEEVMAQVEKIKLETQKAIRSNGHKSQHFFGKTIQGEPIPLKQIMEAPHVQIISGEVFSMDKQNLRNGQIIYRFDLYDGTDSLTVKVMLRDASNSNSGNSTNAYGQRNRIIPQRMDELKEGHWVLVSGKASMDRFEENELTFLADAVNEMQAPQKKRPDLAPQKRVELHAHTNMSSMDALPEAGALVKRAYEMGHKAIAITDHGVLQAYPEAAAAAKNLKMKVLYGCEIYLIDHLEDRRYKHCVVLTKNKKGLKELYKLTSKAHLYNFYKRPRVLRADLLASRSELIVGSACAYGELYSTLIDGFEGNFEKTCQQAKELAKFYDFLEVMPIGHNRFAIENGKVANEEGLRKINRVIYEIGKELGIPVTATGDVHFLEPEDVVFRDILQAGQDYEADETKPLLHLRNTEEMLAEFNDWTAEEAYEVVVTNTNLIADQIEDFNPMMNKLYPPNIPGAEEELKQLTYQTARKMYGDPLPKNVLERIQWELDCIIGYGYAVNYYIAHKLVKKSMDDGYLVGSRGSVGSSLVATLTGITEVNPLSAHYRCPECSYSDFTHDKEYDCGADMPDQLCPKCGNPLIKDGFNIRFEVFMGFAGDKIPDIDLNFSGEYQSQAHKYTEELFGKEFVFRAGTISTVASKTAYGFVMKYVEKTGAQLRKAEINRLTMRCTGVKRTTGQHPGGLMVVPNDMDIHDFTAVQHPPGKDGADIITTHFTYQAIHDNLLKLDLLGHDDPTILRKLQELTNLDVRAVPLDDPKTMKLFVSTEPIGVRSEDIDSDTGTYGVPEFGTPFTRNMLMDAKPRYISDLIRLSGFSHGTDVWAGNARELIVQQNVPLAEAISTRDAILLYLTSKGIDNQPAFQIMESVRKGRGLKAEEEELMRSKGVPEWYITSCKKIKYLFPKAHAAAYVLSGFRIAWFKVHQPLAFYASYFTVRAAGNFDADLTSQGIPAVRNEVGNLRRKGNEATANEKNMQTHLELALEAMFRGIGFDKVDLYTSEAGEWKIMPNQRLLPPFSALQGVGINAAEAIVEARKAGPFTSIEDLSIRSRANKTVIEVLKKHGCLDQLTETDQLTLF